MTLERSIFLCGFMGAGKSTVGQILGRICGVSFWDLDALIEKSENKSISEIFDQNGEAYFRDLEATVLKKIDLKLASVIALGGGSLIHPGIRELIEKYGDLIYLTASESTILERLGPELMKRPLLAKLPDLERRRKISALMREREALYSQAILKFETDSLTPAQIAENIAKSLRGDAHEKKT